MGSSRISPHWDYTAQAPYYQHRPDYAPRAIERLCSLIGAPARGEGARNAGAGTAAGFAAADIGAGSGNLSLLLADRVPRIFAIEPNEAMRKIGMERTRERGHIEWRDATAEDTGLAESSVDWALFGSSLNTTDAPRALVETHRILKAGGWMSCLWNHRDLADPTQKRVEDIIRAHVPHYTHGSRRESPEAAIDASGLFDRAEYIEEKRMVRTRLDDYINAWRSVRNRYWDLRTQEGQTLFENIFAHVKRELEETPSFEIPYTTVAWSARRR